MRTGVLVSIPIMLLLAVLQSAVLPVFPVLGSVAQLGFLFAVAWGVIRGPYEGAIWAFIAGLFQDLFSIAPFGGASLTYMAAVAAVAALRGVLPGNRFVMPLALAALATFLQQVLYWAFLWLTGFGPPLTVLAGLPATIFVQTLFFLPIYGALLLLQRLLWPAQVRIETG